MNIYKVYVTGHYHYTEDKEKRSKFFIGDWNVVAKNVSEAMQKSLDSVWRWVEGITNSDDIIIDDFNFNNVSLIEEVIIDIV